MKDPNISLPNWELRQALFTRLDGNIFRLDGTTPLSVYDEVPENFRDFDFLEIDSLDVTPTDSNPKLYECEIIINVYSTYAGFKELSDELNQVHRFLGSVVRGMTEFTDISQGGVFVGCQEVKKESEEGDIVRHGLYRRRYGISDNRL